eukprot:gene4489-6345_t
MVNSSRKLIQFLKFLCYGTIFVFFTLIIFQRANVNTDPSTNRNGPLTYDFTAHISHLSNKNHSNSLEWWNLDLDEIANGLANGDLSVLTNGFLNLFENNSNTSEQILDKTSLAIESSKNTILQQSSSLAKTNDNKNKEIQIEQTLIDIEKFVKKIDSTLEWISDHADQPSFIRWDLLAVSEIHILYKLSKYLKRMIYNKNYNNKVRFVNEIYNGYKCTAMQATQQKAISKYISMDICSEVEWYKLLHVTTPDMRDFIDVGANKGYLGSLFVALWGGGGIGITPAKVFAASNRLKTWKGSRNPAGYCRDGYSAAVPMHCPPNYRNNYNGECLLINHNNHNQIKITSIDGSSYLMRINKLIQSELQKSSKIKFFENNNKNNDNNNNKNIINPHNVWNYVNYAVSNKKGTVRFTKQDENNNAGYEGGSIKSSDGSRRLGASNTLDNTEEVSMTSIDEFMKDELMSSLDLLKIDTEGNDNKVLLGAEYAIKKLLKVFTFEGGKGVSFTEEMINNFDELGYNCYSTSRAGLFKWNNHCMPTAFMGSFSQKDKGNIFCVHRTRAPLAAMSFDILSFPKLIEEYLVDLYSNQTNKVVPINAKNKLAMFTVGVESTNPVEFTPRISVREKMHGYEGGSGGDELFGLSLESSQLLLNGDGEGSNVLPIDEKNNIDI